MPTSPIITYGAGRVDPLKMPDYAALREALQEGP